MAHARDCLIGRYLLGNKLPREGGFNNFDLLRDHEPRLELQSHLFYSDQPC